MALVLIYGHPGGGKTYTAVADYILPALDAGRRVVHNIAGLKEGIKFGDCPLFPKVNFSDDGEITFEHEADDGNPARIRGGDLVVIDEWYLVRRQHKTSSRQLSWWESNFHDFLRAHRHYVGGGGCCDILMLAQTDHDIEDAIKLCAERMHILKTYTLDSSKLKRLDFSGGQQRMAGARAENAVSEPHIFRPLPEVFARYSSYTGAAAVKERIRGYSFWKVYAAAIRAASFAGLALAFGAYWIVAQVVPSFWATDETAAPSAPPAAVAVRAAATSCALRLDGECFYDRIAINRGGLPRDKKE